MLSAAGRSGKGSMAVMLTAVVAAVIKLADFLGQLQKSVDALGGGLTKIYCQVVYEERNKVCTFAT